MKKENVKRAAELIEELGHFDRFMSGSFVSCAGTPCEATIHSGGCGWSVFIDRETAAALLAAERARIEGELRALGVEDAGEGK